MYDELVRCLREHAKPWNCADNCICRDAVKRGYGSCSDELAKLAADAIEELQSDNAALNGTVSNLIQQIEELSKPRWIPVKERLPIGGDDSGAVCENACLMMDDGTVSCGWMNGITKKVYYLNARDDVVIKAPITRVTHWMPLPQPPTEEEGE